LREAQITAGLKHPNTVRVFDVGGGDADNPLYLVMELIDGPTLEAGLRGLRGRGVTMS
jgi:serine/threonine protein kinase